jgi:ABC-type Fe3+/spermidine/putrescine transport system ATPase subunit
LITVAGLTKRFGSTVAVDDVSLDIAENEFFALLGPSGCGKTTLLRLLAGFERPDEGRILLGGEDITDRKPYRRPLNMMFQSYALFPHMTVERNVAYGLRMERRPKEEIQETVREALATVQMTELAKRRPAQLSGGQRQRVALARALVKRPKVLLLDEPLSALDRQIRGEMQIELKRLQHAVGITFVVVTHDQEEALGLADRIAVMRDGEVLQVGTPDELYRRPSSLFVASFLGESNLVDGPRGPAVVRPEHVRLVAPGEGLLDGKLVEVVYAGATLKLVVETEGRTFLVRVARLDGHGPGDQVGLLWDPADAIPVDAA